MLRMDQVHVIRHKVLVEGRSQRSVARELGLSRTTVSKYVEEAEPRRRESRPRARPTFVAIKQRIEELVSSWRVTRKQRLTGTRVHRQLVEEGHAVGVTTVRGYLRELRRHGQEVYVPLVHRPGEEAQVDFFEVAVVVAGVPRRVWKFLLYLPYSGWTFAWLYEQCDSLSFLDGHVRAFAQLGGVTVRVVYDNLTLAVKRRVGAERELQERFRALVSHYLYEPCFTRPGEGHDKGAVESRGKGVRLQHLVPVPAGGSLHELAERLQSALGSQHAERQRRDASVGERWVAEQACLQPLPERPFEARQVLLVEISSQSLVRVAGATYSVPSRWARGSATAYVGVEDVRLVCGGEQIVVGRAAKGTRHIEYRHYVHELARKPQALRQVAAQLVTELGEPYGRLWAWLVAQYGERDGARLLAKVLAAVVDHGLEPVGSAVRAALAAERCDLLALQRALASPARQVTVPERLRAVTVEQRSAHEYDALLAEAGR